MQTQRWKERLIVGGAAMVLLVCSILIFDDRILAMFLFHDSSVNSQLIGHVTIAKSDVRRKKVRTLTWLPLDSSTQVYEGDSIFTGQKSEARIALAGGIEISIAPNSLVVLTQTAGHTDLNVQYGSIEGHITGTPSAPVKINVNGRETELKGDKAKIKVASDGKNTDLAVIEDSLDLISPARNQHFWLGDQQREIEFQWSGTPKASQFELQVASQKDFSKMLIRKKVNGNHFKAIDFPQADTNQLYWRLDVDGQNSQISKFYVFPDHAPLLVAPADKAEIPLGTRADGIDETALKIPLEWHDDTGAQSYRVDIATDADFRNRVQQKETNAQGLQTDSLPEGNYFWRVQALHPQRKNPPWSSIGHFSITKPLRLPVVEPPSLPQAPQIMSDNSNMPLKSEAKPQEVESVPIEQRQKILKEKVAHPPVLNWKPVENADAYEVQITSKNDEEFDHPVVDKKLRENQFAWKNAEPGQYIWRVMAMNEDGERGDPSESGTLNLSGVSPEALSADHIKDRVPSSADMNRPLQDVEVKWMPVVGGREYEVQVADNPNFNNAKTYTTPDMSMKVTPPQLGDNYWRVRPLNGQKRAIADYSPAYKVEYKRLVELDPPAHILPAARSTLVVVGNGNADIIFSWSKVERAKKYVLELSTSPRFDTKVLREETTNQKILVSKNLQTGRYFWRVQALGDEINSPWQEPSAFILRKRSPK